MCHVTISLLNKLEKIGREEYNFLKLEAIKFILCQANYLTLGTTILIGILLRTVGLIRINNTSARTRGFCCKIGSQMSERYERQMWPTEDILQGLHQYSMQQNARSHENAVTCRFLKSTDQLISSLFLNVYTYTGDSSLRIQYMINMVNVSLLQGPDWPRVYASSSVVLNRKLQSDR